MRIAKVLSKRVLFLCEPAIFFTFSVTFEFFTLLNWECIFLITVKKNPWLPLHSKNKIIIMNTE